MLDRLKQFFAPKNGADVETVERPSADAPVDLPVGGMIAGVPPVVLPEGRGDETERSDEPQP
jgi:hypothetical protein